MSWTSRLPSQKLAGVVVPDTILIRDALKFARLHSNDAFYNHVQRSWLFGFIIASKIPELRNRDMEVHALAAILHDLGFDPERKGATKDRRVEVDSADLARLFLEEKLGNDESWDSHRMQLVWDAIALHAIGSIVFHKEPEVQAAAYGIWADFQGPEAVPNRLLSAEEYNEVVRAFPRLQILKKMTEAWIDQCHWKPETTYDTAGAEIGEKYVEGYSRKGKTTLDFLEACKLDEIDPNSVINCLEGIRVGYTVTEDIYFHCGPETMYFVEPEEMGGMMVNSIDLDSLVIREYEELEELGKEGEGGF